ncbi:MAG TPA: hypothetical protein VD736_05905 [Nitrososphaera sp.]|nr:hypothetical protein [Nitrososphaera sp.]
MNTKKICVAPLLAAVLLLANTGVVFNGNLAVAQASENVTISTSADDHGRRFFGEGVVQVVITDRNADDDDDDVIEVEIEAESEGSSRFDSGIFEIPNTNPGSQRFEFFLVHAASQYADGIADDGTELDPRNGEGFDDLSDGFDGIGAPIIRFGTDAGSGVELDTGDSLYEQVEFEIRYGNKQIDFSYEESKGQLGTDREVYGTDSIVYILIRDQDANLNPTERDSFNVKDADLDELFEISGASFVDDVVFEETADNSAIFEAELQLVKADTGSDDPAELVFSSSSVSLSLSDMVNYADVTGPENDAGSTSDTSFVIENDDGMLDDVGTIMFGSELKLVLRDNDQNKDSDDDETLVDVVSVRVGNGDTNGNSVFNAGESDQESVSMEETDDNSGVFIIDGSNNELRITFLADGQNPVPNNGILELRQIDIDKDITVSYKDPLDDDSSTSVTSSFRKKLQIVTGQVNLPGTASVNDKFVLTITDADLNDNPRTRDSYSFILTGGSGTFDLKRGGGLPIGDLATIEIEIGGNAPAFADDITYVLSEIDINSGVFKATLDMGDILASAGISADDGDRFKVTYNDLMGKTARESSATLIIQRSSTAVDFSRELLPIPPEDDPSDPAPESSVGALVGTSSVTTLIVTDVRENTQSGVENTIDFNFRNDPGSPRPAFSLRVERDGIRETIDTTAKYDGTDPSGELGNTGIFLADILPELPTLREIGRSTGVFDAELEFVNDGALDSDEWHDLKIVFTYYNDVGDDESAGITFRGSTGLISADMNSVMVGDNITITVYDPDLNLNDAEEEKFRTSLNTQGVFIVAIEPDDNDLDIETVDTKLFRETGLDSGIFTASFIIGSDIPVAEEDRGELNQATVIHITYNDEIDATGRSGDEMELDVPIVTSTGSIRIMPEMIGPGTKLTVLIADSDLNLNPLRTDKFEGDNDGDGIVVFRTDRKDAGKASPDLEETGSDTGVFQFEIELVPVEDGEDGDPVEVEGGSAPRIGVLPGDLLAVRYEDENDGSGNSVTVSEVIEVMSWDPEFAADKESYEENDRVTITIADPDTNRDPDIADSIRDVRVTSESDRVGRTYSAIETGKDSGVFRLSFLLTTGTQSGAISARNGDEVTVSYEDEFPRDYAQRVEDRDNPEKKFFYTFVVGVSSSGTAATTPSAPTIRDIAGDELAELMVGRQAVLSTTIKNNNANVQPFLAIVEVRNSQQVTESLEWQTGSLNPDGSVDIGISWTPERTGTYQIRTFVISDFERLDILSPVAISEVVVQ